MAEMNFNTTPGETVARELLIAYLNTGSAEEPVWSPIGKRVEDSSIEFDWSTETKNDILGDTYTIGKKATKTQTFDPWELDGGDAAQLKIWNLAVKENNVNALLNQDMLIAHFYATGNFAERYSACAVLPTGLGGEGGGSVAMPVDVTYGGTRSVGTVSKDASGKVTFTAEEV
jgi:hypothetical protein